MKKNTYSLLSFAVLSALYSGVSVADLKLQCLAGVPQFHGELVEGNPNELPVYIEADRAELTQSVNAKYEGNVEIQQGNRYLTAASAEITQQQQGTHFQRMAHVLGHFKYKDNMLHLDGTAADINLNNKDTDIQNANYQFVNRQGRGTATEVELREHYRVMRNASFTSCLPNDNTWSIEASEMRQHIAEEYAEMWHARFKVHGIPIFYTPYLQLPIGDRRRSGLLMPTVGTSSRDGYFYAQPFYWNIAPNLDSTFTPKYMSKRGWQLNGEFRYLSPIGEGKIAGEYLGHDKAQSGVLNQRSRHLFYWTHNSSFLENWRLDLDYTRVSDKQYFTDFDSEYGNSTDGYADQRARIAYYQPNYNIALAVKQFQIFDEIEIGPYRALPQLDINYYKNNVAKLLDFKLFAQAVRFDNKSPVMPKAWRFHIEPSANLPLSNRYGSLNIETKLYATTYRQKSGNSPAAEAVKGKINRLLPQIKVDFQTVLASHQTFIEGYTQTLEPRVQYLYRPYKNQSQIGSQMNNAYLGFGYDSSLLQQDYFALFRDRRYSGLDRIASANQVTVGGTTRIYDKKGHERFNFSAGQIYYLQDSRIDNSAENSTYGRSSSWSLESNWKMNDQWRWRGSYQYDTRLNKSSLGNFTLEYNPQGNNVVQVGYRYASQEYIDQNLTSSANRYGQDIKQLGGAIAWELTDNWAVVARHYQDLALKKPVEQYFGVEYRTCCWAVNVGAKRSVTSRPNQKENEIFYDKSLGVNFELRGLGTTDHKSNIEKMLQRGKLPYLHAFSVY
ncbi:LPS assembly protein LptD [Pasteurella sp. PK-2025]|uniref:LPS assembly protein LptD n=1 Tax=Pasteurella sp. PK-2025 TaxID=3413133 RepID=UPI003C72A09A